MESINFQIPKFSAFVDTDVLHSSHTRDIIFRLAEKGTFRVQWSNDVLRELRNSLAKAPKISDAKITNLIDTMSEAFSDALITGYDNILPDLELPDKDDVHVVAAAVRGRCDVIVTYNLGDFPPAVLAPFDIDVQHPDVFLSHHLSLEPDITLRAVKEHIKDMRKPPLSLEDYLERLRTAKLVTFAASLKEVGSLIL